MDGLAFLARERSSRPRGERKRATSMGLPSGRMRCSMRLFIMRHGPSEEQGPSGRDFDRRLSNAGRAKTTAVARQLRLRGETLQRIYTSPLIRARETAELVATEFDGAVIDVSEALAPSEDAYDLVLGLLSGSDESVLLVSHSPDVSLLAERLLGRRVASFEPATVLALDVAQHHIVARFTIGHSATVEP